MKSEKEKWREILETYNDIDTLFAMLKEASANYGELKSKLIGMILEAIFNG